MAIIITYSLATDGNLRASKDFKVREFACKDGSDTILICPETVSILQAVRDYFGNPVTINSAYRTATHNKAVGGAKNSQHVKGTACDIKVKNVPSWAVAGFLEAKYPNHGIGLYSTFVHIDSRGYKSYWKNSGSNTVSTFGIKDNYTKYKAEEEMTITEIKTALLNDDDFIKQAAEKYLSKVSKENGSNWSKQARDWSVAYGLFSGDNTGFHWKSAITREQVAQALYNQHKRELDDGK